MSIGKSLEQARLGGLLLLCLLLCTFTASGAVLDLTVEGNSGTINGAFFTTTSEHSTGSGVIHSFVRISAANQDDVQGYNTDGRPLQYDENNSATFTHSLTLSLVPIVSIGGVEYREFLLDINQNANDPLLSLNEVQIWLRDEPDELDFSPSCTVTNCAGSSFGSGDKVWGLDLAGEDNTVELNYVLDPGSGWGDVFVYVPNELFTGTNEFVYLYSKFGDLNNNNDGYEEWAVRAPASMVPEPTSVALFGTVLAGVGFWLRKRRTA